jgi:hypothetical protein
MLQMVSEPTLAVSRARKGQVRRIRGSVRVRDVGTYAWRVGPLGGTRHGTYAANWTCGTRMLILDVRYTYANTGRTDVAKRGRSWLRDRR